MASEANRRKLQVGIWSGYAVAVAFTALALIAHWQRLIAWSWTYYGLIVAKLATNTLAWWSLRRRVLVLEAQGLNLVADLVVITGAIYLTGAQTSPLFAAYVIEIAVVAMLSNRGITVLTSALAVACYGGMSLLVYAGVLPARPAPVDYTGGVTGAYVAVDFAVRFGLLAGLTYYLAAVLRVLRERERKLERHARALIDAQQHKREFMTNMTHELRTPIHGVLGVAEILESGVYGELTEQQRRAIDAARTNATQLLRMVDDLLALARADSGKLDVRRARFPLAPLLRETVSAARWMCGRKPLTIELDIAEDLPEIDSDRDLVAQLVVNLLSNAIKFTPDDGRVTVRARRRGTGWVEIVVDDTGVGIPAGELPHIFEPFRQVDGTSSRRYGGAGVGLSLVKTAAEALGGGVRADSAPGRGATFTVTLPLYAPVAGDGSRASSASDAADATSTTAR
ncbi:MAG: sensor histidine kinase [Deltaproteobacteria bacterium]|nr:MAG: sensor histidine kinase [Deltaproteobacteria bacterium]